MQFALPRESDSSEANTKQRQRRGFRQCGGPPGCNRACQPAVFKACRIANHRVLKVIKGARRWTGVMYVCKVVAARCWDGTDAIDERAEINISAAKGVIPNFRQRVRVPKNGQRNRIKTSSARNCRVKCDREAAIN